MKLEELYKGRQGRPGKGAIPSTIKGKTRDILAKEAGIKSGRTFNKIKN